MEMKNYKNIFFYFFLFFLLISYFIFIDNFSNLKEVVGFFSQKAFFKGLIYLVIYLLGILSVLLLLLWRKSRYIILLILFITSVIELGYRKLSDLGFGYEDALLIIQEFDSQLTKESILTYGNFFIQPFFISLFFIVLLFFLLKRIQVSAKIGFFGLFLLLISVLGAYKIITISNGIRTAFVSVIKEPLLLYYASTHKLYIGERNLVSIPIISYPKFKHIVYIVDESTRGDILSLNGYKIDTTPFLKSIKSKIFNYEVASSGAVCSNYSNAILLTGIQVDKLPDKDQISRKRPIIFQYAKKAGFRTSFFDMQNSKEKPNNFLQKTDWKCVDNSFFLSDDYKKEIKAYERDLIGLKQLKDYLEVHKKDYTFTYFVKEGNHFSYINKYPKSEEVFKPVLQDSGWGEWNLKIKSKFLNTYYNSIRWEVDNFFKVLTKELNNTDTIIIYTSDHGQNLIDELNIKQTHCAKGPAPKVMAKVPFFVFPMDDISFNNFKKLYKKANVNHISHFNIFGSLLVLMGYNKKIVNRMYGLTIFDDLSHQKRIFTSGDIFGRSKMFKNEYDKE